MAFRSISIYQGVSNESSMPMTMPAGVVASDILIACIVANGSNSGAAITAAGWTVIQTSGNQGNGLCVTYLWAPGSVATTTFGLTNIATNTWGSISAFSGRNTSAPISASAINIAPTGSSGAIGSATQIAPSVTAVANDDLYVNWISAQATAMGTVPLPLTQRDLSQIKTNAGGNLFYDAIGTYDSVAAGATTAYTETPTYFYYDVAVQISLAAASGGSAYPIPPRHPVGATSFNALGIWR